MGKLLSKILSCYESSSASQKMILVSLKFFAIGKHGQFVSLQKKLRFTCKMGRYNFSVKFLITRTTTLYWTSFFREFIAKSEM